MKRRFNNIYKIFSLLAGVCLLLSNYSNPPNGRTGAPGETTCAACHDGNNPNGYTGDIVMTGIGTTVMPNATYPITVTINNPSSAAIRGGFQLVAISNGVNCGDMLNAGTNTTLTTANSKEYAEHNPGLTFGTGTAITFTFDWKAPATLTNNNITFYMSGVIGNGAGDANDLVVNSSKSTTLQGAVPPSVTINSTNVLCNGANNGTATAVVTGATGTPTYAWNNGSTNATLNNISAGTYTVTVSATNGTSTASTIITQPNAINVAVTNQSVVTCVAGGSATVNATGGTGGFNYVWNNGTANATINNVGVGTYTVTASDNSGCTKTQTVTITSNTTPPTAVAFNNGPITCLMPQILLTGLGSTSGTGITYAWSSNSGNIVSGANTLSPVINGPGNYVLTVTNNVNGCSSVANTNVVQNITVPSLSCQDVAINCWSPTAMINSGSFGAIAWTGPNGFTANTHSAMVSAAGTYTAIVTNTESGCTNTCDLIVSYDTLPPPLVVTQSANALDCENSSITLTATGANNYYWSTMTGGNTLVVTNPGVYTVTAANPNACIATVEVNITQSAVAPTVNINASANTFDCTTNNITLTANAGTNATYTWSNQSTGNTLVAQSAGTYTVTATLGGCSTISSIILGTNISTPSINIEPANPVLDCSNSTIDLSINNSNNNNNVLTYFWSNGGTSNVLNVNTAGIYTVTATDVATGCTATAWVNVTKDASLPTVNIVSDGNLDCNSTSVNISATASLPNVTYQWSGPNDFFASESNINVSSVGEYSLLVKTNGGCAVTQTIVVNEDYNLPEVVIESNVTVLDCNNPTVLLTASEAVSYLWDNGETTQSTILSYAGDFNVRVVGENGCENQATINITEDFKVPNVNFQDVMLNCYQTEVDLAEGLSPDYTYTWGNGSSVISGAGTYKVTVTGSNGCTLEYIGNVSTDYTAPSAAISANLTLLDCTNNIAVLTAQTNAETVNFLWSDNTVYQNTYVDQAGIYSVMITNIDNGCSNSANIEISASNDFPMVSIESGTITCSNPSVTLTATSNSADDSFSWQGPEPINTQNPTVQTAGTYTVTVLNTAGCSTTQSVDVLIDADAPMAVATVNGSLDCNTTSLTLNGEGSSVGDNYSYIWNALGGNIVTGENTLNPTVDAVGSYELLVTNNGNGCSDFVIVTVTETLPFTISDMPIITTPSCNGGSDGAITVEAVGDNPPYNYTWSNGVDGDALTGIAAGIYTVTVTDANTCFVTAEYTLSQPDPIVYTITVVDEVDMQMNGNIGLTTTGGTAPYIVDWNVGDGTNLAMGTYSATITDINGCSIVTENITVDNITGLDNINDAQVNIAPNPNSGNFSIQSQQDMKAEWVKIMNVQGQQQSFTWQQNGNNSMLIQMNNVAAGIYFVQVANDKINRNFKIIIVKE